MRQSNRINPQHAKELARLEYADRKIEKWIKWSNETRGCIKYKELVEIHDKYNINCYG